MDHGSHFFYALEKRRGAKKHISCLLAEDSTPSQKGDPGDLRNWHPVSLLSMDYKVIVKAISLWLGSVLVDVIHPDQTYTHPGAYNL
ncbi:unnamed protein product [Caretta caretta]